MLHQSCLLRTNTGTLSDSQHEKLCHLTCSIYMNELAFILNNDHWGSCEFGLFCARYENNSNVDIFWTN